ncbi:MAG: hypothetical protein B9S33_19880 [Pedosphaera sp. Tous-C6FEB]|nr:MAG: hypothetical protein B9S33_19880 [Pedosphaera sp. Tous-C6FEB]
MASPLVLYRLIQQLISQDGPVSAQMAKLLVHYNQALPATQLAVLQALDYDSELSIVSGRLQTAVAASPPTKTPGGIYFGLFLPGRPDGSIVADFYLAATDEHDPADAECNWVASLDYFPPDGQACSQVLERIYQLLSGVSEGDRNAAEDVLCLGYTGFVVAHVLNAPDLRAWCSDGRAIPVAIGWDSGDVLRIGELTANGFRAHEPAKKPKRKARSSGLDHISKLGAVVHFVPPPYEPPSAPPQVELYPVSVNGWFGFINPRGELAIEPRFADVSDFSEDLAGVKHDGVWGFINPAGVKVIEPRYNMKCGRFHCGLAAVEDGFINKKGDLVIPWKHRYPELVQPFRCERIFLDNPCSDPEWVCLDERGATIFSGFSATPRGYNEGLLKLVLYDPGRTVFLDRMGRTAMSLPFYQRGRGFDLARNFSEGLAALHLGKHGCGYMDRTGRIMFRLKRGEVGPNCDFSENRAAFWFDGKFGFVDREGNEVVEPQFETVEPFSNGLACVGVGGKYGFINPAGTMQIPCRFDFNLSSGFQGALAHVVEEQREKLINQTGETIWHGPPWSP